MSIARATDTRCAKSIDLGGLRGTGAKERALIDKRRARISATGGEPSWSARVALPHLAGENRGEPFAVGRRESQQSGGELGERVVTVGPFAFVVVSGVIVFRHTGTSTGTSGGRRWRKALYCRRFGIIANPNMHGLPVVGTSTGTSGEGVKSSVPVALTAIRASACLSDQPQGVAPASDSIGPGHVQELRIGVGVHGQSQSSE